MIIQGIFLEVIKIELRSSDWCRDSINLFIAVITIII